LVHTLADRVAPGGGTLPGIREKELAELHRTIQVWSF
jgi:hypothetical protein